MKLVQVTGPSVEPVSIQELRNFLRIDDQDLEPSPKKLTAALAGSSGSVDAGVHRYRATFVTADGETDGGVISSAVTATTADGKVNLSAIPLGGSRVTSRKIYRTAANGSDYLLLAAISDNTTSTFQDNVADASLGAGCPTENTTDDPDLVRIRKAARLMVERHLEKKLITQTFDYYLDDFPKKSTQRIELPFTALQSVTSITYTDTDGNEQTWESSKYLVVTEENPGYIVPKYNYDYPDTLDQEKVVKIRYVAGYGDDGSAVPANVLQALMVTAGHLYETRQITAGTQQYEIPKGAAWLLDADAVTSL